MGLLTGKCRVETTFGADDVCRSWNLHEGDRAVMLNAWRRRGVLTTGGRTLAQGALGWLWARSGAPIPITGFKTVAQVEENAGALQFGPLMTEQMRQIEAITRT